MLLLRVFQAGIFLNSPEDADLKHVSMTELEKSAKNL